MKANIKYERTTSSSSILMFRVKVLEKKSKIKVKVTTVGLKL